MGDELSRDEAKRELERIVRESSNDSARISAIRQLREMWVEDERGADADEQPEGFEALDELASRRDRPQAA